MHCLRKKTAHKIVFFATFILLTYIADAQVFWTETFSSACASGCTLPYTGVNGTWTWVSTGTNGGYANTWFVSRAEGGMGRTQCGAAGPPASLHVGNVANSPASILCPAGDCGAAYDASTSAIITNARATSPAINCTGKTSITLQFNYIMNGEAGYDYATVDYYNGTSWALLASPAITALCGAQGKWTHYNVALPASANNNANVQIGFNWQNNGNNSGNDPSFAVDSVTLSVPVVLPVELLSFSATYNNNSNKVDVWWSTATETNNALFTVERSTDGELFTPVATVKGAGNSNETKYYSTVDPTILGGIVYYKLMQTDYDGHSSYSIIVSVDESNPQYVKLFPDPASDKITLIYYASKAGEQDDIYIYDYMGRLLKTQNILAGNKDANSCIINIASLAKGLYFIKLNTLDKTFFNKFVKE